MILFPNVAMEVCRWISQQLAAIAPGQPWSQPVVTNRWDDEDLAQIGWAVIVRNDGGTDDSVISQNVSLGVTCFGPRGSSEAEEIQCENLAQHVAAVLRDCARPGVENPFAGCTDLTGPYPIPSETMRPAYYLTCRLEIVGRGI